MKTLEAITTANSEKDQKELEFKETIKILGNSSMRRSQVWLIKRVYERAVMEGHGELWGAMNVYELGRQAGIREERERRRSSIA